MINITSRKYPGNSLKQKQRVIMQFELYNTNVSENYINIIISDCFRTKITKYIFIKLHTYTNT